MIILYRFFSNYLHETEFENVSICSVATDVVFVHFKWVSKFLQSRASANRSTETIISLSPQTVCPGSTVTSSRSDEQLELFTRGSSDHPIIGSQAFQLNTPPNESLAPSYPTRRPNFGSTATPRCLAHSIRQKVGCFKVKFSCGAHNNCWTHPLISAHPNSKLHK